MRKALNTVFSPRMETIFHDHFLRAPLRVSFTALKTLKRRNSYLLATAQLVMPCGEPCTCLPGYVECAPNTCCLRYKNMARRYSKTFNQLKQKVFHSPSNKNTYSREENLDDSRPVDEKSVGIVV